ncbi:MBL fold metallo-hydrolase [Thalassotalea ganghwensis]
MTKFSAIAAVTLLLSQSVVAQTTPATIDSLQLTEHIAFHRINSDKGNTTSVTFKVGNDVLLVDPNFNNTSELLKEKILTDNDTKIRYVTSSHDHRDHIEQYGQFAHQAIIVIPANQAQAVTQWGGKPTITYTGSLTLNINDKQVELMTLPHAVGHTDGDELVYFPAENILYVGDYYFSKGYPIIDKYTGDIYGYIENLSFITKQYNDKTLVIPGHTTFAPDAMTTHSIDDIKRYTEVLKHTIALIKAMYDQGLSLEQAQEKGLPKQFSAYNVNKSFRNEQRWIRDVYHYFAKQ